MLHPHNNEGMQANPTAEVAPCPRKEELELHPAWRAFLMYCMRLRHGEIEKLKIQDGLPMSAEVTRKKIKFT